jgi:Pyruvate/2-oxoacid:ferredoxin oxidoreductase gamma subunit
MPLRRNTAIVFTGRGGQGVLTASSITAHVFFLSGYDVKKSDMKGIARRGGKVLSTLIAGEKVYDPKVIPEIADIAIVLCHDTGLTFSEMTNVILPTEEEMKRFNRSLNMFCLGKLSSILDLPLEHWEIAVRERFESSVSMNNLSAFYQGIEKGESIYSQDKKIVQKIF